MDLKDCRSFHVYGLNQKNEAFLCIMEIE